MRKATAVVLIVGMAAILFSCFGSNKKSASQLAAEKYQQHVIELEEAVNGLVLAIEGNQPESQLQERFKLARIAYKKIEWLVEYFNPYTAKHINGPALQEVEEDEKAIVIEPVGFQVIEEFLFPAYNSGQKKELLEQAKMLQSVMKRLQLMSETVKASDMQIFDALRLQIFRITALGISGFDSPIANNSIVEAATSLQAVADFYRIYNGQVREKKKDLADSIASLFSGAQKFLSANRDFENFDRAAFIAGFLNPIAANLLAAQEATGIPVVDERRVVRTDAPHLFAQSSFNPEFFTADMQAASSPEKVVLGRKLFYDGILSMNGKRSCASCHNPDKGFADALTKSVSVDGRNTVKRNAPTLINAALQPALFYDTRVSFLEDQATDVIMNKDEMHGSFENAIKRIKEDRFYFEGFVLAFKTEALNDWHIRNALASYIRSLIALNSRFDQYMRGNKKAMNSDEIKGFNLFMGKAKCGTCHFVPLFNGANPPLFEKIDSEVIGVPATADSVHVSLDKDDGKYSLYKVELHKNAFKTPTLRNIELTAPYMHNGVYKTLEEVVEFYNRGGGKGLGLKLENQTLPEDKLNLTFDEKSALVAFMKALTDTVSYGNKTRVHSVKGL